MSAETTFYHPRGQVMVDPSLPLSSTYEPEIDPITYEVIRHNLWNVNEEHGVTMANVSGSPVAVYAHDFNPSILTELGEFVYFGPYVQFFSGMTDLLVRWVLEHRGDNPGIREGDMFLSNDPLIATHHQNDVYVLAPVFHNGELFCWTANALHQYDIGGNTPGSFCIDANDIFDEPVPIPPIKIVEGGELRRDVVDMYTRHSRLPRIMGLDLRAQVAGNNVARSRIAALVERYGADIVKGVMHKIIRDGESSFLEKLSTIPDGEWAARGYLESAHPGDRDLYEVRTRLRKQGSELTFDNSGTHEQTGTLNTTFAGWRGGILAVVNSFLCYDMLFAAGGALRHLSFEPQPGTILSVEHPGATSCAPAFGTQAAIDLAHECVVKMLSASPEQRHVVAAPGGHSQTALVALHGRDQRGHEFGTILTDHMIGSLGAFPNRDGVSTGGIYWDPQCVAPNIEFNEQHYPILCLYRREGAGTGGAGAFRGGNSAMMGFVSHGTDELGHVLIGAGVAVPGAGGLAGGSPSATSWYRLRRETDVRQRFADGKVPTDLDALQGQEELLSPKTRLVQHPDDVFEIGWTASGGYGDPYDRPPELVVADVRDGLLDSETARAVHGVVIVEGELDAGATRKERAAEQARRSALPRARSGAVSTAQGGVLGEASEQLLLVNAAEGPVLACARCRTELGGAADNYKEGCTREDLPLTAISHRMSDPHRWVDPEMAFRCFYCPGCGRRLGTEIARASDPVLHDLRVTADESNG